MEKTIGAYEARRRFGQLIEEAYYKRDHFIVERSGRPMAAIVSIEDYEKWRRLAKEGIFSLIEPVWQRNVDVPAEEIEDDIKSGIAQLREEHRE